MFNSDYRLQHKTLFDILYFAGFLALIIVGAMVINAFVFRTFNVVGPSMENTLHEGDRLVVNKVPATFAHLQGKAFLPDRGQVIVFQNPMFDTMRSDEFIVKRVMGLPGERVVVHDGVVMIFNKQNPKGFNPDTSLQGPKSPTDGDVDVTVPADELFVMGDNRNGNHSLDSRNGLSTIPLKDVEGTVAIRLFPFDKIRTF
ncbi:MAG TPA: signal peptidase I [Candidatus Saccharimonadales bacterium]|jgi:signal peptidase I|nr:signal peptidase I [Candidatus Saccharimonadales bacterium]